MIRTPQVGQAWLTVGNEVVILDEQRDEEAYTCRYLTAGGWYWEKCAITKADLLRKVSL